jgi:hypothetical protein
MTKTELLALADEKPTIINDDLYAWATQAAAALREYAGTMDAEPVAWEYRWTNPGNQTPQPDEMLEWKPIEHPNGQTLQEKIADLEAYRYDGKPCYEVRKLFTSTPSPQRDPLTEFQRMRIIGDEFPLALVDPIVIAKVDSVCLAIESAHGITAPSPTTITWDAQGRRIVNGVLAQDAK